MTDTLARILAVTGISLRESWRAGLLVLALAASATAVGLVLSAAGVDAAASRRLAVAGVATCAGLVTMLSAPLIMAVQLRRDLDARAALTLFSRPIARDHYVIGRWLGALAAAAAAGLITVTIGMGAVLIVHGAHPLALISSADGWSGTGPGGTRIELRDRPSYKLDGPAGGAVRWSFAAADPGDVIALRLRVQGPAGGLATLRVKAVAIVGEQRLALPIAADSPFAAEANAPDEAKIPARGPEHRDVVRDRLRVAVPAAALAADGSLTVEFIRLDEQFTCTADPTSCQLLRPSLGVMVAGFIAVIMAVAGAGMAAAAAAGLIPTGGVGVAVLGAIAVLVAGATATALGDAGDDRTVPLALRRIFRLAAWALPDLGAAFAGSELAAGRALAVRGIATVWWSVLPVTVVILLLSAWRWRRVEP